MGGCLRLAALLLAAGADARWSHDNKGKKQHRTGQTPRPHKFLALCGDDQYIYPISCRFRAETKWPQFVDGFTYLTYPWCEPHDTTTFPDTSITVHGACSLKDVTGASGKYVQVAVDDKGTVNTCVKVHPTDPAYTGSRADNCLDHPGDESLASEDTPTGHRDPLIWPLMTHTPGASGVTDLVNVFQPVIVSIGERESNPHHLKWPNSRQPTCFANELPAPGQARVTPTYGNSEGNCECHGASPYCKALDDLHLLRANAILLGTANSDAQVRRLADPSWDPSTIDVWDRIEIRDGLLLSTTFHKKYTPGECARLCNKMSNFRNNKCIAFSRKWITTQKDEHADCAGRDGDVGCELLNKRPGLGGAGAQASGTKVVPGVTYGYSAHVTYKYPAQCVFFGFMKDNGVSGSGVITDYKISNLCSTVEDWLKDEYGYLYANGVSASGTGEREPANVNSCKSRHGLATNNWKGQTRSWRMIGIAASATKRGSASSDGFRMFDPTAQCTTANPGNADACSEDGLGSWPRATQNKVWNNDYAPPTYSDSKVYQEGRRLSINETDVHEFILPNGTSFWSDESQEGAVIPPP